MNSDNSKLKQHQRSEQQQNFAEAAKQIEGREFASVDELLRYDSEQNPVPPEVAARVNASIAAEPKPRRPWYKALFG